MKDFLLICNKNCITYKEFFPFIKDRKVNIGYTHPGVFGQPAEDTHKSMQGLTRWFSTLSTSDKPPLILTKTYDPEKYPKYDNYDAINVDRVKDIPWDYDGVIGCPITILDHNLDNVEIEGIWNDEREEADFIVKGTPTYIDEKHKSFQGPVVDGKAKYARVLIKKNFEIVDLSRFLQDSRGMSKEFVDAYYSQGNTGQICEGHPDLCFYGKGKAVVPYMRVLIRTKHAFIPEVENNPQE